MVLIHLDLNFDLGVTLPRIHFEIIRAVFKSSNDLPSRAGVRKLVEKGTYSSPLQRLIVH